MGKGLAAILATKRLAGVTQNMTLKNPLHTGNKPNKQGLPTLGLKPRDVTRSPKQGYRRPCKKSWFVGRKGRVVLKERLEVLSQKEWVVSK